MLIFSFWGYSQIGINTENPQAFFHIDGAGDNEKKGSVTEAHQVNDIVVTSEGKMGIGTDAPTNSLHIKSSSDPLKLEGLSNGDQSQNSILSIDNTGIVKNIGTISALGLWNTKGNMGTDPSTNFLGTTNAQDLKIRTNNTERMRISATGNVIIGDPVTGTGTSDDPNILLNIKGKMKATATSDPLTLNGVEVGSVANDKLIAINTDGTVKTLGTIGDLGIPSPALFRLEEGISNFLINKNNGEKEAVPMTLVSNAIPELTYNPATYVLTFPEGIYQMMFAYEATHDANGCTISSYFVDFPSDNTTTRIHNNSDHSQGGNSNHGGNIVFSAKINANTNWPIALGRGQSGNCSGAGMTLIKWSTYLLIFKIGNIQKP